MDFKCDELILGKKDADSRALTNQEAYNNLQHICLRPLYNDYHMHFLMRNLV